MAVIQAEIPEIVVTLPQDYAKWPAFPWCLVREFERLTGTCREASISIVRHAVHNSCGTTRRRSEYLADRKGAR